MKTGPFDPREIRVLCVDDDADTVALLRRLIELEPDMLCVGAEASADELADSIERTGATVLLLDLAMPGADPLRALEEARARTPGLVALVVTAFDDPLLVRSALAHGARGFVTKGSAIAGLAGDIRRAWRGERVLSWGRRARRARGR